MDKKKPNKKQSVPVAKIAPDRSLEEITKDWDEGKSVLIVELCRLAKATNKTIVPVGRRGHVVLVDREPNAQKRTSETSQPN